MRYKTILDNLFFVGLVQVFGLVAPLITYPYLVKVLGMDLYGMVITAQVLVSYATLLIDFGSNSVCAKNISIFRDDKSKLSEIISAVLSTRFIIWVVCFFIYLGVVILISTYREYWPLFLISYLLTMNELLFPQFFFQGLEKMKVVSLLNILVKILFILLVFLFVQEKDDYMFVPILYATGYVTAGFIALYIIFKRYGINYVVPRFKTQWTYLKECSPILAKDLISTIKDKFNYMFVGIFVGMNNMVIYDLGLKFVTLMALPSNIVTTVLLPRFAQNRSVWKLKKVVRLVFLMSICLVVILNICMEYIVHFFLHQEIELLPLRLFSVAPIFLCVSLVIAHNFFIGFGYNKYMFYSILVTTMVYVVLLISIWIFGYLNSIYSFIFLSVISYFTEFIYRLCVFRKLTKHL